MIATRLIADLARLGIRLEARGDRLRYAPRSAVTPELANRMKGHKTELLEVLRIEADMPSIDQTDATAIWQMVLDRLVGDPLFPSDVIDALRAADVQWASIESPTDDFKSVNLGSDGWLAISIDPDELEPCPQCGTLELWQTLAGNWRCRRCDPPTTARRVQERVAQMKSNHAGSPGSNPFDAPTRTELISNATSDV